MSNFHEVLVVCELRDLGYPLPCAITKGENRIFKRLDCFLANSQWCDLFPLGSICHGQVAYSDHYPLWLNTKGTQFTRSIPKVFRFEAMWAKEEECSNIIDEVWLSSTMDGSIRQLCNSLRSVIYT